MTNTYASALRLVVLPGVLLNVEPLAAQEPVCASSTFTIQQCLDAQRQAVLGRDRSQQARAETAGKPAGEANAGELTPTIDDFIPRLSTALLAPGLDTSMVLRLVTNQSLDTELTGYLPAAVRFGAELRRPTVYGSMLDSVPESRRSQVRERFEKDLSEIDNIELTAGINRESRWKGRRYESHRSELERVVATPDDAIEDAFGDLRGLLTPLMVQNIAGCTPVPGNLAEVKLGCLTPDARATIESALATLAGEIGAFELGYQQWAERTGWKYVPDLINNQPQLSFHATWRPRPNDAVGPESWSIRGRWEGGRTNMNAVRNFCERRVMDSSTGERGYQNGQFHPRCFADYVRSDRTQRRMRMGLRAFLQSELTREHRFWAPFLESDTARFQTPHLWVLTATGGIGGYLPTSSQIQGSRIDLGAEVQWASRDDPLRSPRRTLVSLSLTQRLNQNFSLLSGVVWSNRGEFGDDDVQRVRVNLGVRYKLVPTAQPAAP